MLAAVLLAQVLIAGIAAAAAADLRVVVIEREDDPLYERADGADGLYRVQRYRPYPGAEVGLKDIAALTQAAGAPVTLARRVIEADQSIKDALKEELASGGAAFLLDLPDADLRAAAQTLPRGAAALFNIREPSDALRRDLCGSDLLHVPPSLSGLTDALAQFIVKRNWKKVLSLVGPESEDAAFARAFEASARKFGARIVDTKPYVDGNDPRQREQTNTTS